MAIQFNQDALHAFRNVDFGNVDGIANLDNGGGVKQNGALGNVIGRIFRLPSTKANNNAVRTELLKALGQAFNLQGVGEHNGRTTFSRDFMNKLEEILGPDFKRDDFGIDANAELAGLTNRQLSDYVKKLCKSGDAEAVKDDIAYVTGIKDAPVKDNKVEPVKDNKDDGFRSSAREILVVQVKVPDADFERLTNQEIANFLETLRETRDPSSVRDAIAMTVEDRAAPKSNSNKPNGEVVDINAY